MRNTIIDNLRGICMLGVIGIHIGSLALAPNSFMLYCFLEILSRYSVPTFFFISGYGLACTDKNLLTGGALNYWKFIKKRFRSAGLPYVSWSLFYLAYFWLILPSGYISWHPLHIAFVLFFGLGCYHLYFMVILLWFYGSYPLWRTLLRYITKHNAVISLILLFIFQLALNWWTTHPNIDASHWSILARNFFTYRLNYLPLHYLLIFMSGCLTAVYWQNFITWLRRNGLLVIIFYITAIIYHAGSAYYSYNYKGYSLLDLANTYHQLSPQGLVYTIASIIFFCWALDIIEEKCIAAKNTQQNSLTSATVNKLNKLTHIIQKFISLLSHYSMLIYFLHPLLLEWMTSLYTKFGIVMTVKKVTFSYFALVVGALLVSIVLSKIFAICSTLSLLFTGKK